MTNSHSSTCSLRGSPRTGQELTLGLSRMTNRPALRREGFRCRWRRALAVGVDGRSGNPLAIPVPTVAFLSLFLNCSDRSRRSALLTFEAFPNCRDQSRRMDAEARECRLKRTDPKNGDPDRREYPNATSAVWPHVEPRSAITQHACQRRRSA